MPIPEERLYKPNSINLWFAVSSVIMTASIVWMIWIDYDRPWRKHQDNFYLSIAALAHLDYLDSIRDDRMQEIEDAETRLKDARESTIASARARIVDNLAEAELQFKIAGDPWSRISQTLEVTKDTYERALRQHGSQAKATVAAHAQLIKEQEQEESLRIKKEECDDVLSDLKADLLELDKPVRDAQKYLEQLQRAGIDAQAKDRQYRGVLTDDGILAGVPIVSAIINMPLLDFTAP